MDIPQKVIITGPESSGKTRLTQALAHHFSVPYLKEYARTYLPTLNRPYQLVDLLTIAQEQFLAEEALLGELLLTKSSPPFYFCDTSLLVIKIWSEEVFNTCPPWIIERLTNLKKAYFLLLKPDIPWEADPLRENPYDRDRLFTIYQAQLDELGLNYGLVSGGDFEVRKRQAMVCLGF